MQRICGDESFGALEFHVIVKHSLSSLGVIFTPVGNQSVFPVYQCSTLKEISIFVQSVIVQTVGAQDLSAVFQHHILPGPHHLFLSIIISSVGHQRQGVALSETYMSESLHGIVGLIEVSTVTGQPGTLMSKRHMPFEYLRFWVGSIQVITQLIRMQEFYAVFLLRLFLVALSRKNLRYTKSKQA